MKKKLSRDVVGVAFTSSIPMKSARLKSTKPKIKKAERYAWFLPMLQARWPDAVAEFKFHGLRKWRADFAIPSKRLLIEIDGGIFSGGRHTRGAGFLADMEKMNNATMLGYRVLRYSPQQLKNYTEVLVDIQFCVIGWTIAKLTDTK
jgi:very-short-patch-repair endonuclease